MLRFVFDGQIHSTTGYKEVTGQGVIAGIIKNNGKRVFASWEGERLTIQGIC